MSGLSFSGPGTGVTGDFIYGDAFSGATNDSTQDGHVSFRISLDDAVTGTGTLTEFLKLEPDGDAYSSYMYINAGTDASLTAGSRSLKMISPIGSDPNEYSCLRLSGNSGDSYNHTGVCAGDKMSFITAQSDATSVGGFYDEVNNQFFLKQDTDQITIYPGSSDYLQIHSNPRQFQFYTGAVKIISDTTASSDVLLDVQSNYSYAVIAYTGLSGTFNDGTASYGTSTEVVTGSTSGATGNILRDNGSNTMYLEVTSGTFQTSETITGSTTGATATVSTVTSYGGANTVIAEIRANGDCYNLSQNYTGNSDLRLKENIVDAKSQWEDIKALRFRNFEMKKDPGNTRFGFIAQELLQTSPGCVSSTKMNVGTVRERNILSINTSALLLKGLKALQEAQARVEELESKILTT